MTVFIKHERWKCISCGNCAAIAPEFWEMDDEFVAHLKNSEVKEELVDGSKEKVFYLEIEDKDRDVNEEAAESCPVDCIHVLDKLDEE